MRFFAIKILIFTVLFLPLAFASTVTLDKDLYAETETATVTVTCAGNEKNRAYTINWTNVTGFQIELDTGNTGDCTTFLETFIVNATFTDEYGTELNVTIQGTNLEGADNSTVSAAGSTALLITGITHRGTFLGLSSSVDATVLDENDKKVTGGLCNVIVEDPSNDQVLDIIETKMIDGQINAKWILDYQRFKEGKDYVAKTNCFCGSIGSIFECADEDGINVNGSVGTSDIPFRTSIWINFDVDPLNVTLHNGSTFDRHTIPLFAGYDEIHWVRNVTNNNPDNESIEVRTRTILVKNDTRQAFGKINEGSGLGELGGFPFGNSTSLNSHLLTKTADTGRYLIRIVYDVIYKNQFQVAQYIKATETFNITSLQDIFEIEDTEVHDFFGADVNLSSSTLSSTVAPDSTNSSPYIVLSEAFAFDFCIVANNTRTEDITVYLHRLTLENTILNTSYPIISAESLGNEQLVSLENSNGTEFCITERLPETLATHSDYRFSFSIHIGTESEEFICDDACEFEGHTDFFYVLKLTDMIEMPKFINDPTATVDGNPGIRIVTRRGEYLPMFNDINYTNQQDTDWDNTAAVCTGKDDEAAQACNYTFFPRAGEEIKVCFEGRNYFSDEVFVNLFDIYLDSDQGDSQIILPNGESLEVGIKSVTDNDLYVGNAPSRALEADGNLTDGYATYCSDWLKLPNNVVGGNTWDVQGRATLDPHLYDLTGDKNWDWESDEFPIYGLFTTYPTWNLHLFNPIHYNIPERWDRITTSQYIFNLTIPSLGRNGGLFNFGEHLPFRLLDENTPLERIINVTVTRLNGSTIPYNTSLFVQFDQIVFLIENVNTSRADNNFTITVNTFDYANLSFTALEGSRIALVDIANKTGTFHFAVDCPATISIGTELTCNITAQLEGDQFVQKEVDFTCFITGENGERISTLNFNQMVNRSLLTIERNFLVPSNVTSDVPLTLDCEAGYYNFGSRIDRPDTFSDSFTPTRSLSPSVFSLEAPSDIEDIKDGDDRVFRFELPTEKETNLIIVLAIITIFSFFIIRSKRKSKN